MPSPNAAAASRRAAPIAPASCEGSLTSRMPRPPPPNAALTSSGKPTCAAASCSPSESTVTPGSTGTPAAAMVALAATLSLIAWIVPGDGPTKVRPASAQARANAAFSDRNP